MRRMPVVQYLTASTEGHQKKHLLGVFDSEQIIHDGDINANANYAACDELERRGWEKVGHNHDLRRGGVEVRIRSLPLMQPSGFVDESFVDLEDPARVAERAALLGERLLAEAGRGAPHDRGPAPG